MCVGWIIPSRLSEKPVVYYSNHSIYHCSLFLDNISHRMLFLKIIQYCILLGLQHYTISAANNLIFLISLNFFCYLTVLI